MYSVPAVLLPPVNARATLASEARMSSRLVSVFAFGCLLAVTALGQGGGTTMSTNGSVSGSFTTPGPPPFAVPAVTGAPYSGEEVTERVQTLADGTHIIQTMPGRRMFRDSQGRTRSERPLAIGPRAAESPMIVEITDPVAGFEYTLDSQKKIAHRFAVPPQPNQGQTGRILASPRPAMVRSGDFTAAISATPPPDGIAVGAMVAAPLAARAGQQQDGRPQPDFKNESLGIQTIDGVLCEGRRTTTTYPTDFMGNDRPIVVTQETWTSPELRMTILSKTNDPRSGENTFHILNLSRTEPDASLFQPPPDYSVVDDTGPVTVYVGK